MIIKIINILHFLLLSNDELGCQVLGPYLVLKRYAAIIIDGQEHPATTSFAEFSWRNSGAADAYIRKRPGSGPQSLKYQVLIMKCDILMHVSMEQIDILAQFKQIVQRFRILRPPLPGLKKTVQGSVGEK